MSKQKLNKEGFHLIMIPLLIVIVGIIGFAGWYVYNSNNKTDTVLNDTVKTTNPVKTTPIPSTTANPTATPTQTNLSNDQIYQEVATQLSLNRDSVIYFRIYGQDKVAYKTGNGVTYAYKQNASWQIAQKDGQGLIACADLVNVPEQYRPPCLDISNQTKYLENSVSTNYPGTKAVYYIGQ